MYQNPQSIFNPYAQNITIIKNHFKKPIVLINAIVGALSIVLMLISMLFITPYTDSMYNYMFDGAEDLTVDVSSIFTGTMIGSYSIALIMPTLTVIAFFILYYKSKNDSPESSPVAGASILSVISLIQLIIICIFLGIAVLFLTIGLIVVIATSQPDDEESIVAIVGLSIMLFLTLIMSAIILMYSINQRRYYKSVKEGLSSPVLSSKGASVFGVMSIIMGAMNLINAAPSTLSVTFTGMSSSVIEQKFGNTFDGIMPYIAIMTVASLCSAVHVLLTGLIATDYNKYIKAVAFSYNAPPVYTYNQPFAPVAPAPYPTPVQTQPNSFEIAQDDATIPVEYNKTDNDTIICPNCKKQLPKEIIFCDSCGNKVQ